MAENKKSFVLYCDLIHTIEHLEDDEAGRVFKHLLAYVNDRQPTSTDRIVRLIFEQIKQQLKRDLKKYEDKRKQWSEAGKKSAEKRAKTKLISTTVNDRSTDSTVNVSVNDNVNVIQNINPPKVSQKKNEKNDLLRGPGQIPTKDEFLEYVQKTIPEKYESLKFALGLKYEAWVNAGWKTGGKKPRPIKNWKSTILNTIPYLEGTKPESSKIIPADKEYNFIKNY